VGFPRSVLVGVESSRWFTTRSRGWGAPSVGPLKTKPTRAAKCPVERGRDPLALHHHDNLFLLIAQPVALEEQTDLFLGPFGFAFRASEPTVS